jgi:hypothetical protein
MLAGVVGYGVAHESAGRASAGRVPGTGKSALAKAPGAETGRPTLILDVEAQMGSLVGSTEDNIGVWPPLSQTTRSAGNPAAEPRRPRNLHSGVARNV